MRLDNILTRKEGRKEGRNAFSLAEMLLVLAIISFLILALPPLIHKNVAKRITRGEHGRYECWKDLEGNTYEYYATEKNGIEDKYLGGGTEREPLGHKLAEGERCTFDAKTMAPNAAYFAFQAIGGGSGGSYAPYNGNDGIFRNDTFSKEAKIKSAYGDGDDTPTTTTELSGKNESNTSPPLPTRSGTYHRYFNLEHSDSIDKFWHYNEAELFLDYDYHKTNGIKILMALDNELKWLEDYFTSVKATGPLIVYTPSGHSGTPYLNNSGFTESTIEKDGKETHYRNFTLIWGGQGSPGFEAKFDDPRVGHNSPITINFSYPTGVNSGVGDLNDYFANTSKYAFFYNKSEDTAGAAAGHITKKWVKLCSEENQIPGCSSIEGTPELEDVAIGCLTDDSPNRTKIEGSPCWMEKLIGTVHDKHFYQPVSSYDDETNGLAAIVTFDQRSSDINRNIMGGPPEGKYCANSENVQKIVIPYGRTGTNATSEMEGQPPAKEVSSYMVATPAYCGINFTITPASSRSVTRLTLNSKLENLFPKEITMKNENGFIMPTYGYAGGSGKSVLMMLPAIRDKLEFEIGKGGGAGTKTNKIGGVASETVVWAKDKSVSSQCSSGTSGCEQILEAKGGLGVMGGAASNRLFMRGFKTNCQAGKKTGSGIVNMVESMTPLTVTQAAGCIDEGVGTYSEAPKRFSVSSGFYSIPELDSKSKTPSAIDNFYKKKYTYTVAGSKKLTFLPGTGGDGGYSFIVNNSGTETITATGHTNFNAEVLRIEKSEKNWVDAGSSTVKKTYTNILPTEEDIQTNYKCYKITDSEESVGTGGGFNEQFGFEKIDDKVYACKPSTGYPGAVVIVW